MVKKEFYQISKSQLKTGIRKSLLGAIELAGYAKDMAERGGNTTLALGLYSFAIEEYGRSLFFSKLLEKDHDNYSVPKVLFRGKKSHDLKFKKALATLPEECSRHHIGGEFFVPSPNKIVEMSVESTKKLVIYPWIAGTFAMEDFPTDFETRLSCFYLDWNDEKNKWRTSPSVMPEKLVKAITAFEQLVSKKLDLEYDAKENR